MTSVEHSRDASRTFSDDVEVINEHGGLHFLFQSHRDEADAHEVAGAVSHGSIVAREGAQWNQTESVVQAIADHSAGDESMSYEDALETFLYRKNATLLPFDYELPGDALHTLLALPIDNLSDEELARYQKRYEKLQHARELRAAVGGIAFLAEFLTDPASSDMTRGVSVTYGSHHAYSLPALAEELGVSTVTAKVLDPWAEKHLVALPVAECPSSERVNYIHQVAKRRLARITMRSE